MATIKKTFTQKHVATDSEARNWKWFDETEETYEELVEALASRWNGWFDAVRVVEKTFDDETFAITEKIIKQTDRVYEGFYWKEGEVKETIF